MRRITAAGQYAMSVRDLSDATELPDHTVRRLLYWLELEGKRSPTGALARSGITSLRTPRRMTNPEKQVAACYPVD